MKRMQKPRVLIWLSALLAVSTAFLPFAAAQSHTDLPSSLSGASKVRDSGPSGTLSFSETIGPVTIGEGESVEFTTVAPSFADLPNLPDSFYPGELTVEIEGPIVVESGGTLFIGTNAIGGMQEASPVIKGTLSEEPLIVVKAGGSLTFTDVEFSLEGSGLLIRQEPGGIVELHLTEIGEDLVSWGPAVADNSSRAPEDVWIREGEALTPELLPQTMYVAVKERGKENWQTLSLCWDVSGCDGQTSGEAVLTGEFLDENGEPVLSAFPLTVTVRWYEADLLVTQTVWKGKDVPSALLTVPNLPTDHSVEVWGEVSEDGGETWEQWMLWDEEERFFVTRDVYDTPVCVFVPPDTTPRLYRVCAQDSREERVWTSDSFLLPGEEDETEDQGGNRGGSTTLYPLDREPDSSSLPASSSSVSETPSSEAESSGSQENTASAPAESAPPAESAAHNGGENNAPSAESTPQTGVAVPSAEESGGVQQPSVQTGALTEPGALSVSESPEQDAAAEEEFPDAPALTDPQSDVPDRETVASSSPSAEETSVSGGQSGTSLSPAVQAVLVITGLAVCVAAGMVVAGIGPFRRKN